MASTKLNSNNIINFILFQLVWVGFVLGAANNFIWVGCAVLVAMLTWQLWPSRRHESDIIAILASAGAGLILASGWSSSGLIVYQNHWPIEQVAPWWIIALWVSFGASFNHSLRWIQKSPFLAGSLAAIGGPFSYLAAERVGAVTIHEPWITLSLMALAWFLIAFLLTILVQHYRQAEQSGLADASY